MRIKDDDLARWSIGGLVAAVFVSLTLWLVRAEGERTRQAIRDAADEFRERAVKWPDAATAVPVSVSASADVNDRASPAVPILAAEPEETDGSEPIAPATAPADDFDWEDYDIFPGMRPALDNGED